MVFPCNKKHRINGMAIELFIHDAEEKQILR